MKCKTWFPVAIFLLFALVLAALLPPIARLIQSFPEILVGQVVLAGETKPISARAYQSAEFVLNQVALSEVERAFFIPLYEDVLFWEPQYVGYRRTELSRDEIRQLQGLLSAGRLFHRSSDGHSYQCVFQSPLQAPKLETCPAGEQYQDQLISQQWQAELNHAVSVLQFFLTGGRVAEIRVYPTENGLAYTPHEISGDWWLNGVTGPSPLLAELASRAALPSIPVLWPELTASQANARAARILGERYRMAVEVIQASPAVRQAFGPVQEIRPAIGNNYSSTWMDSSSVFLSFRLLGANGQGAVLIRGYDCFDLLMVFQGIPVEEGNSDICP